jgi:ABC-2 type transport system permease protein
LGVSGAEAYLSVALLIMAVALAFISIGLINAARGEESSGELENLLVRPYSRLTWIVQRFSQTIIVLVLCGLLAGIATWTGAVADGAHVRFTTLVDAGLNVAVPAVLLLGVGILAIGLVPRFVNAVTYGLFAFFFLIEILGSAIDLNHWVLDLSAFHQMAASPATPEDWTTNGVMAALALTAAGVGVAVFRRRDLKGP